MNTAMKYALPEGGAAGTKAIWVGRILSALAIAFFVMDGVMKLPSRPIDTIYMRHLFICAIFICAIYEP